MHVRLQRLAFKPTPLTGWWGAGYFRSAGAMGDIEETVADEGQETNASKLGFDEDDQAALYMLVGTRSCMSSSALLSCCTDQAALSALLGCITPLTKVCEVCAAWVCCAFHCLKFEV